MRPGPLLACSALLLALAPDARAEGHAPALVRLLHTPGRAHPLADAAGRVPLSVALPPGVSAASLGLLQVAPGVGAIRLPPEEVGVFAAAHPALALGVAPRLHPLLDVSGAWTHVPALRQASGLSGRSVIIGVVDTGLDVRHPDFLTAEGHTRVAWMLVGGAPVGKHPELEAAFGCTDPKQSSCAVYAAADIDAVIMAGEGPITDTDGHGTHVSSIAAGNGGVSLPSPSRFVGMAPEATLIVAAPSMDGGFLDTDILNGARFIFDRAAAMGLPPGCSGDACAPADCAGPGCEPVPVVVNLSLGGDYGPHDGTSALEQGLSAFVGDDAPGRAIVVAAGNSGVVAAPADGLIPLCTGAGWICGIHTEVHVAAHELVRVPFVAGAAQSGEGFVWITFRPGSDVSVGLEGPGGKTWVSLTGKGNQGSYVGGGDQGSVVNDLPSTAADIGPATNSAVVAFTGAWAAGSELAVLLQGSGDAQLWITGQKDSADNLFFERALRQGTINVPASAPALLSVGCTINRLEWTPLGSRPIEIDAFATDSAPVPDGSCYFSAEGPTATGAQKPEISAPGAFVVAAMSAAADPRVAPGGLFDLTGCPAESPFCAVVDSHHAVATGTSMSAPHVTGAVALLMELDLSLQRDACQKLLPGVSPHRCPVTPTLTQATVTSLLQAGARLSGGHVPDPDQLGPGSLDADGALRVFVDDSPTPTAAAPDRSWYTLSSAYARPDPTWPVWGTVELRRADGSLAAGIDGADLTVSLKHAGTLIQPLTQVRPGLFRFAFAAGPTEAGETIALDVLYGGVSLGARALPVGFDVWSADDPTLTAVSGGCAFPRGGTRHGPGGLAVLALAAAACRRRARAR